MSDQNPYSNEKPAAPDGDPEEYQSYTDPVSGEEKPETETGEKSIFGSEILSILEGFGEEIKRLSKTVNQNIDKEALSKAADSVKDALNDAGDEIKRATQNMGEKLEEERVQRAITLLKDYARRTGKSIQDIFSEDHPNPCASPQGKTAENHEKAPEYSAHDTDENDINFENTFGG